MFGDAEVEVFEEFGDAGEEADTPDVAGFRLIKKGADQKTTGSVTFGFGVDSYGEDLGEVLAIDVECSTADEPAGGGFDDSEGLDVRADFGVAPGQQNAVVGEAVDELVDCAGVL
jgi:hypothetical protein